jgi:hypothetical protein
MRNLAAPTFVASTCARLSFLNVFAIPSADPAIYTDPSWSLLNTSAH